MSYARRGPDSDVYVFRNASDDKLDCYECRLEDEPGKTVKFDKPSEMVAHLDEHIDVGHNVPAHCLRRLTFEVTREERETAYLQAWIVVEETMFDDDGKIRVEERPVIKGIRILSDSNPECLGPGSWAIITSAEGVTYPDARRNLRTLCETWHPGLIPHIEW